MKKRTSFLLSKNNYIVCELPDITCETTGHCIWRPTSGVQLETKPLDTNLPLSELGVTPAWLDDSEDKDEADEETVKNESVEDEVDNEEIFEDELDEEVVESSVSPLAWPSFFIVAMTSQPEASLNWT